jgi:hypothetical protein
VGNYVTRTKDGIIRSGTLAEHWNGHRWHLQKTANPTDGDLSYLRTVSCSSASACTAVGHYFPNFFRNHNLALVERWDGHKWSLERTPRPTGAQDSFLSGVSCPTRRACTAVGIYRVRHDHQFALAERWNGRRWKLTGVKEPTGARVSQLSGVSCPFPATCTSAGYWARQFPGAKAGRALAERYS